jgi:hypothetical protein
MALEYFVQYACPVRERISDAELLQMHKSRSRALATLDALRANPETDRSRPESEWSIAVRTVGPEGTTERRVTLADLFAESAPLDELAPHCQGCGANVMQRPFGCGGAIHYPITADVEAWLLARLPDDLGSAVGKSLMDTLAQPGLDGAAIDAARQRPDLFASARPAERRWGGGLFTRKTVVRSSQILQLVMGPDHLEPGQARMLAWYLGYIDPQGAVLKRADNAPAEGDSDRVVEMKLFLLCLTLAGLTESRLLLEP